MSFVEQSSEKITVPAKLPMILKQFCKAAIRTQPYDLLKWSCSYFRALANGEEPPVKSRLEYPPPSTMSGLTLGFLRVLLRQFGSTMNYNKTLSIETIARRWDCLCLDRREFHMIVTVGKFRLNCQVKKFLAIAVSFLGANLTETMIMICQLFTHEPEGGSAMIPLSLFMEIYEYLASLASNTNEKGLFEDTILCRDSSIQHTCSINSQDADMDVNIDLEPTKEEFDLSKIELSMELLESNSCKIEDMNREERKNTLFGKDDINKDYAIGKKFYGIEDVNSNDGSLFSQTERDSEVTQTYAANVPGIGIHLSAERIANVAMWMAECARLQEGMVGPRNIRHTDCPSLD